MPEARSDGHHDEDDDDDISLFSAFPTISASINFGDHFLLFLSLSLFLVPSIRITFSSTTECDTKQCSAVGGCIPFLAFSLFFLRSADEKHKKEAEKMMKERNFSRLSQSLSLVSPVRPLKLGHQIQFIIRGQSKAAAPPKEGWIYPPHPSFVGLGLRLHGRPRHATSLKKRNLTKRNCLLFTNKST